jgi:hydroxymethylglutaryl-CoA lyase
MNDGFIFINEVGPRDGLQNEPELIESSKRTDFVRSLISTGVPGIEIASFVRSDIVPQMSGAKEIVQNLQEENACDLSVLVPNLTGYKIAKDSGATNVAVVPAATEQMNINNINMTLSQAIQESCDIINLIKSDGLKARAYIAVAWECPFEGKVEEKTVLGLADKLVGAGADEIILADTIGAANPFNVESLFKKLISRQYDVEISAHFHDTRAMALANVWSAINAGIKKFDSSIGGLGGCPFAPGASGNLATEDIVLMLHQAGFQTGVDEVKLMKAVDSASELLGRKVGGRMTSWISRNY